ncbi:MAG TPA: fatty acid desaturase [Anaeromyxobacteraceae bacterium]
MTHIKFEVVMSQAVAAPPPADRIHWVKSVPFLAVHVVALATLVVGPFSWPLVALALASYFVRMFGITAGYHRYFAHRSYRTSRAFQLVLAVLGATCTQKGALWWAAHHRDHHRFSDQPEDIHSPLQRGFWWGHVGWILSTRHDATKLERIKDFARYPELRWLDRFHVVPPIAYASLLLVLGGAPALLWGYFVSTVFLWHGTFLVNSLAHVFGRRRYETSDGSRNSLLIALATLGEGWHNNHHHYQSAANQGWFWWEIDVTWYALRALAALGVVRDLRTPPAAVRDRGSTAPAAAAGEPSLTA